MKKEDLVYLVRQKERVVVQKELPEGVVLFLDDLKWSFRTFIFSIGEDDCGRLLYADGWVGPIGVYDCRDFTHVEQMILQTRKHTVSLVTEQIKNNLRQVSLRIPSGPRIGKPQATLSFFQVEHAIISTLEADSD